MFLALSLRAQRQRMADLCMRRGIACIHMLKESGNERESEKGRGTEKGKSRCKENENGKESCERERESKDWTGSNENARELNMSNENMPTKWRNEVNSLVTIDLLSRESMVGCAKTLMLHHPNESLPNKPAMGMATQ